ncbi:hypothetical protein BSKO_06959 [Bryopsis sp. KO-2023]|nr:hypothetical protein BSKO_06959 [Bryopsis sp. KO-2023]
MEDAADEVISLEEMMDSLSSEERAHFIEAFNEIDTDKTGSIDKHELGAFLALKWKHVVPNKTIDSIIGLVDENRDGKLQYDEFVMLQLKYIPKCRGYCKDCKNILIGNDNYGCPKCSYTKNTDGLPELRSFTLCPMCFAKNEKKPHKHSYDQFRKLAYSPVVLGQGAEGDEEISERKLKGKDTFQRRIVQKILEENYRGKKGYWGGAAVDCLVQ